MKMFIDGSCDIACLCSNMGIEANDTLYIMELKNPEFETQVVRHEEKSKVEEVVVKSV